MKQAERKAHKLALIQHLELLALELETRPGFDWPTGLSRKSGGECQRDYSRKVGLAWFEIRMGRTRWRIVPSLIALRNLAKNLERLPIARFAAWTCDELPMVDYFGDWRAAA
jgi:hypothetical protein